MLQYLSSTACLLMNQNQTTEEILSKPILL